MSLFTFELFEGGDIPDHETILFNHDFQKDDLIEALELVKKFIMVNKRILTGGMAIDMALRDKGTFLYKSNKIPDYDFYSPNFHQDAYNLGEQLAQKFKGVSVIRALHVSTMKVRINFVTVADITYVPPIIYDRIPTLNYQGFTIVHPFYQMIDQHRALSLPFENPPRETILARWKKDIERYDLLVEYYPLPDVEDISVISYTHRTKTRLTQTLLKDNCIGGYVAGLLWIQQAIEDDFVYATDKSSIDVLGSIKIEGDHIEVETPDDTPVTFYTDTFPKLLQKIKGTPIYYNPIVDKVPRHIDIESVKTIYQIIDNKGHRIGCWSQPYFTVCNIQSVMCYLLTFYIFYKNVRYLYMYQILQKILFWAADKYSESDFKTNAEERFDKYEKYLPTVEVYGEYNWSESYILMLEDMKVIFKDKERTLVTPRPAYLEKNQRLDDNLYSFEPDQSELYHFDGEKCKAFNERQKM